MQQRAYLIYEVDEAMYRLLTIQIKSFLEETTVGIMLW